MKNHAFDIGFTFQHTAQKMVVFEHYEQYSTVLCKYMLTTVPVRKL